MKKKILPAMPFLIVPVFIPVYTVLDKVLLVDIFGCGCVPYAQTNMLNIPFNANDLRLVVFSALTVGLCLWSIVLSKGFPGKLSRVGYCLGAFVLNAALTVWVVKTFMWG